MIQLEQTKESLLDYKLYQLAKSKKLVLTHKRKGIKYLLCEMQDAVKVKQ